VPISGVKNRRNISKLPSLDHLDVSPNRYQSILEATGFMKPKEGFI